MTNDGAGAAASTPNIKSEKLKFQPTFIQLKTWYSQQKLIVRLLSFDLFIYFIKSFPSTAFLPCSSFALRCIALFIGSICSLINNNNSNSIVLGSNNKKREKIQSWIQCRFAAHLLKFSIGNWLLWNYANWIQLSHVHYLLYNIVMLCNLWSVYCNCRPLHYWECQLDLWLWDMKLCYSISKKHVVSLKCVGTIYFTFYGGEISLVFDFLFGCHWFDMLCYVIFVNPLYKLQFSYNLSYTTTHSNKFWHFSFWFLLIRLVVFALFSPPHRSTWQ